MMLGTNVNSKFVVPLIVKGSVGAEIGVWKAESSVQFLQANPKKLYLVDPWETTHQPTDRYLTRYAGIVGGKSKKHINTYEQKVYQNVVDKFKRDDRVEVLRMKSDQFFDSIEDGHLDWIYVDGAHHYEGVIYDLEQSWVKVRKGGLIFGDDYRWGEKGGKVGVTEAVDEFKGKYNLKPKKLGTTNFVVEVQ